MLLTIDIGTSVFKSALMSFDGNCLSLASVPISTVSEGSRHEADCTQWLRAFENCCSKLLNDGSGLNFADIEAIIIAGNGPSLVAVTGTPNIGPGGMSVQAENARLWLDRRAVKYQVEVSEIMGGFVDAAFFLPKMLGIKNDEKELYDRTKCFLGCPEYLAYALTGEAKTVFPSDGYDRWFWDDSVLEKLGFDTEKFPPFIRPGDPFGLINPTVAEYFGFSKNIPVITGGPDFFAAILGSGVTKPGQACDRTGSSEGINLCTFNRVFDKQLMSYGHPIKPYWNLSGVISTTGKAIQWCRDLLALTDFDDYFALAASSPGGSGGLVFLPYLAGERAPVWDPSLRGGWSGLSLNTDRAHLANSVLEGIGFAIRDVIGVMESTVGVTVDELCVTGGLGGIPAFNQIKADITGKKILEPDFKEAELLGLAIIGACYLGKFSSFAEGSAEMVRIKKHYEPDIKNAEVYDRLFSKYLQMRS